MIRKLLIAIAVLLVVVTGAYLYLRNNKLGDFEPEIKARLNDMVKQGSGGLYNLEIEKLETDILKGKIVLINARLVPDTNVYAKLEKARKAPNDIFEIEVAQLSIDDIEPANFLRKKEIILRRLFINQPRITVWHKKQPYNIHKDSAVSIYEQISKDVNKVSVDSIIVNDIDLIYKNVNKKKEERILNVRLFMEHFLIDSLSERDTSRFLFAKNTLLSLKDYKINTADSLYRCTIGQVDIKTNRRYLEVTNLRFMPRLNQVDFYKRVGHQQDRFELTLPEITCTNIDWWSLLAEETFYAQKIQLTNGKIRVNNDRSLPADKRSKMGKFPHQVLMKIPFDLKVDSIDLDNFDVSYTEFNPVSGLKGTISFNNVYGTIRNVTNNKEEINKKAMCSIGARGQFLGRSPITANFRLNLASAASGDFEVSATLGAIDGPTLNKITRPLAMVEIQKVNVKQVKLNVKGNNVGASSTITLTYDDLKISALKKDEGKLKKRGLLSFMANNFIIKTENPKKGDAVRVEQGYFKRDPAKSFFNLIWKATFVAAGNTVGFKAK